MAKLPRYTRGKLLASGTTAYFWEMPGWAKPPAERLGKPCPVESQPLGNNLALAIRRADTINAAFDAWRMGQGSVEATGTVEWLFKWYRKQDRFTSKSAKTRRDYHGYMDRICAVTMKTGTFGDRRAGAIDAAAADKLYSRFKSQGKRTAAYAMQVCRLVWTWAARHHKTTGVTENPFLKMGIETGAEHGNRDTSRAEYDLYRETARKLGYQSMATAAALSFEFCQRSWDVFGFVDLDGRKQRGFVWSDYQPGQSFVFKQSKTGKRLRIPLFQIVGRQKVPLYTELEEELGRTPQSGVLIVVEERSGHPYTERRMSTVHRLICEAAGLPKKMTFTGFRHGGATELGDAGIEDIRPITGHDQASTTRIYNKANERKAASIAMIRREHLTLLAELQANDDDAATADLSECPKTPVGMKGGTGG